MAVALLVIAGVAVVASAAAATAAAERAKEEADRKEILAQRAVRDESYEALSQVLAQEGVTSSSKSGAASDVGQKTSNALHQVAMENNIEKHKQNAAIAESWIGAVGQIASLGVMASGGSPAGGTPSAGSEAFGAKLRSSNQKAYSNFGYTKSGAAQRDAYNPFSTKSVFGKDYSKLRN